MTQQQAQAEDEALAEAEADAMAFEEVENLLESYFIQIDRTYDRLVSLGGSAPPLSPLAHLACPSCANLAVGGWAVFSVTCVPCINTTAQPALPGLCSIIMHAHCLFESCTVHHYAMTCRAQE